MLFAGIFIAQLMSYLRGSRRSAMVSFEKHEWKEICEAATKELDPEKLMALVAELVKALDARKVPVRQAPES
jgi:hypothetical protein